MLDRSDLIVIGMILLAIVVIFGLIILSESGDCSDGNYACYGHKVQECEALDFFTHSECLIIILDEED